MKFRRKLTMIIKTGRTKAMGRMMSGGMSANMARLPLDNSYRKILTEWEERASGSLCLVD